MPLREGMVLRLHTAALIGDEEPVAVEHSAVKWVGAADLGALEWLEADLAFLPALRELLR